MGSHSDDHASGDGKRLRLIIEAAPNAMIMVDERGRIVLVNSEAERSFGYTRDELLRMGIDELVPERARKAHRAFRDAYFADPNRRGMGVGRELFGLRKDGTELPIEIGLNPIDIDDEHFVLASIIDITERLDGQRAEASARDDVLRRSILDTIPFSILATDPAGRIVTANPAAEALLGFQREELIGAWLTEIDAEPREARLDGTVALERDDQDVEWRYRRKDGTTVVVSEAVVALQDEAGRTTGHLAVAYDIAKRIEARERIEQMLTHDALTDLPNRVRLMDHLAASCAAAARAGSEVALLLLDLDHFKRINDSLGHDVGDALLRQVADRLRAWVRDGDLVARLGGDEFAVVFRDVHPVVDLTPRIEELLQALLAPVEVMGYELIVTASIGAAVFPCNGSDPATLLRHADTAMYRAKASGRDGLQWFHPTMIEETQDKLALSAALRQALGHGELSVVYQPQLDLSSGLVVGVEALARWWSPELGAVSPDRFIPVAEDSGMIHDLGTWVLRQACTDVALLQDQLDQPLRLAVNVSPRQLLRRGWVDEVEKAVADAGLAPDQLEIEVTEGLLVEDRGDAVEKLTAVRELGVKVAVDDFGTGYSSLAYLNTFPIDKIKIDRSFVQGISGDDEPGSAIVDAIIVMAHALGMTVVAEGVENRVQEQYLAARGCDEVQGYLYGAGVPAADLLTKAQVRARARRSAP